MRALTTSLLGGVTALLVATSFAACTPTPAPTEPPSSPSASATPTPSADPTTPPSPTPAAATCETVLTDDGYAKLAADSMTPREPGTHTAFMTSMTDAGGLACRWAKDQTDISLQVAQLHVNASDLPEWEAALAAAGYTRTDDPVPGAYTGPVEPGSGVSPVVVVSGTTLTYVSAPVFATWIAATPSS